MTWTAIARKDFRDARRSKILWGTIAVYTLFVAFILESNRGYSMQGAGDVETTMSSMIGTGMFVLPLAVVVIAYLSITGERESGSVKYLLGLPTRRRDVVLGKFVGRAAVAVVSVLVALLAGGAVMWMLYDPMPVVEYAQFVLLSLYFVVAYVATVVGISAVASSRGKALSGALAVYFPLSVFWVLIDPRTVVSYVVESLLGLDPTPELYQFVLQLSPSAAYTLAGNALILDLGSASASEPFYLQDWFPLVVLLGWIVVPLAVGYWRFRDADLGA